jgi:DNA-binding beta-propeller fold protein YncE
MDVAGAVPIVALAGIVALVSALGLRLWATGAMVRTVTLDQRPLSMALDRRAGRAFIAASDDNAMGRASVFDTRSGALLATVLLGRGVLSPAVSVDEQAGRAFVSDEISRRVSILDAGSGVLLRTVLAGSSPGPPLVDERAGHVLVVDQSDGSMRVLDARTGSLLRIASLGVTPSCMALDNRSGRAFVGAVDGTVRIIDTRSGTLLRTIEVPADVAALVVDERAGRVLVTGYGDTSVYVLDAASGRLLRGVNVGMMPESLSVDGRIGRAFIVDDRTNTIGVLTTRDGTVLHAVSVGQAPGPLAVDASAARVFVFGQGGSSVAVLDARSGALIRTVTVDRTRPGDTSWVDAVAVDERRGRVLVASDNGSTARVTVLDARSGATLRTITVPLSPIAMAVDARSGRAVIAGAPIPQRSAFDVMLDDISDLLGPALSHLSGWSLWGASSTAGSPSPSGSVSVLDTSH